MSGWTQTDRQIGIFSAIALIAIGVVYILTGVIAISTRPLHSVTFQQFDPYLANLENLIILSAVALVVKAVAERETREKQRDRLAPRVRSERPVRTSVGPNRDSGTPR